MVIWCSRKWGFSLHVCLLYKAPSVARKTDFARLSDGHYDRLQGFPPKCTGISRTPLYASSLKSLNIPRKTRCRSHLQPRHHRLHILSWQSLSLVHRRFLRKAFAEKPRKSEENPRRSAKSACYLHNSCFYSHQSVFCRLTFRAIVSESH